MRKRITCLLLALIMMLSSMTMLVQAEEEVTEGVVLAEEVTQDAATTQIEEEDTSGEMVVVEQWVEGPTVLPDAADLPSDEELFAGHVQQQFYGEMMPFGISAGSRLTGLDKILYDAVEPQLANVANGAKNVAEFTITDFGDVDLSWTAAELGLDKIGTVIDGNSKTLDKATLDALGSKLFSVMDITRLMNSFLSDCPYDLYWFNKTKNEGGLGLAYGGIPAENDTEAAITIVALYFSVSKDYEGSNPNSNYDLDTAKTGAASAAAANAQSLVSNNAGKNNAEKLEAYRAAICDLVEYNTAAAGNNPPPYGDPWQLIYVFDGDDDTKVVCEGYSKAFQYLCDLSSFSGGVTCYSVSGNMSVDRTEGVAGGAHMWNVVETDTGIYLVDVTNCDEGMIGADTELFMVTGPSSNGGQTHTITVNGENVVYTYDTTEENLNCDGYLKLGIKSIPGEAKGDINGDDGVDIMDVQRLYAHLNSSEPLSGDAALEAADVNNDGNVDIMDVQRLYAHLNNSEPF